MVPEWMFANCISNYFADLLFRLQTVCACALLYWALCTAPGMAASIVTSLWTVAAASKSLFVTTPLQITIWLLLELCASRVCPWQQATVLSVALMVVLVQVRGKCV
jgi:hypothetical protein